MLLDAGMSSPWWPPGASSDLRRAQEDSDFWRRPHAQTHPELEVTSEALASSSTRGFLSKAKNSPNRGLLFILFSITGHIYINSHWEFPPFKGWLLFQCFQKLK